MKNINLGDISANMKDAYFSPHLLKLDFAQYLYYQLKKKGYNYIYYINYEDDNSIQICCERLCAMEEFEKNIKTGILGLGKNTVFSNKKNRFPFGTKRQLYSLVQSVKIFTKTMERMKTDAYAFVFYENSYDQIFNDKKRKNLTNFFCLGKANDLNPIFIKAKNCSDYMGIEYVDFLDKNWKREVFVKDQIQCMTQKMYLNNITEWSDADRVDGFAEYISNKLYIEKSQEVVGVNVKTLEDIYQKVLLKREKVEMIDTQIKNAGSIL